MTRFRLFASAFIVTAISATFSVADDSVAENTVDSSAVEFRLYNEPSPSAVVEPRVTKSESVMRLRQQRAIYRYNQRVARMEADAWMGHEPLRPSWSSLPMMSSRYPDRRTIIVPVYVD
jgi:hypothetical protein